MPRLHHIALFFALVLLPLVLSACDDAAGVASDISVEIDQSDGSSDVDLDATGDECAGNDDCPDGQVCAFVMSDGGFTLQCAPPVGAGRIGQPCTMDSECQSGLCVNGACAGPCEDDTDCPSGTSCQPTDVNGTTLDICVADPNACQADADCNGDDVCRVDRSGDMVTLTCGPAEGPGDLGTSCTTDSECANNLCLDGQCTLPCERRDDCSTDGSSICRGSDVTTGTGNTSTINVCQEPDPTQCASDNDCSDPQRCVAERTSTELRFTCGDPNAGGESGDTCNADADCAQNLCVDGTCAGPCSAVGDCPSSDFSCDLVDVDLGGGLSDQADLCIAPVPCEDDGACLLSEVCYVETSQTDVSFVCDDPNVGGAGPGELCSGDVDCAANFCFEGRFQDFCANPCNSPDDCEAGYECKDGDIVTDDGMTTVTRQFCQPVDPIPCTSEGDCGTGTVCAIVENEAGDGLESLCIPNTGGASTGAMCTSENECASLVCLDGFCSSPCTATNQCGMNQLCANNNITKNGLSGDFDVCETLPDQACTSTGDCTDGVRECGDLRNNPAQLFCTFPNAGQGDIGEACAADSECFTGLCVDFSSNECSVGCGVDADCGNNSGQICTSYRFGMMNDVGMCARACADNDDCSGGNPGNVCSTNANFRDDAIDRICQIPVGAGDLGATCMTGNECITGLCLTTFQFNGTSCTTDAQCSGGNTCETLLDGSGNMECATTTSNCTNLCDDVTDCAGGVSGNPLTSCSSTVTISRPVSGTPTQISTCARP